jgi:hypothetical protein
MSAGKITNIQEMAVEAMRRKGVHAYKAFVLGAFCGVLLCTSGVPVGFAQTSRQTNETARTLARLWQDIERKKALKQQNLEKESQRLREQQQKDEEAARQRQGIVECKTNGDDAKTGVSIQVAVPLGTGACFNTNQHISIVQSKATIGSTEYRVFTKGASATVKLNQDGTTVFNANGTILKIGNFATQTDCTANQKEKLLDARCSLNLVFDNNKGTIIGGGYTRNITSGPNPEISLTASTKIGKYDVKGTTKWNPETNDRTKQFPGTFNAQISRNIEVDPGLTVTGTLGYTNTCNNLPDLTFGLSGAQKIGSFATVNAGISGSPCKVEKNVGLAVPLWNKGSLSLGYKCTTAFNDPKCLNETNSTLNWDVYNKTKLTLQATRTVDSEGKINQSLGTTIRINTN